MKEKIVSTENSATNIFKSFPLRWIKSLCRFVAIILYLAVLVFLMWNSDEGIGKILQIFIATPLSILLFIFLIKLNKSIKINLPYKIKNKIKTIFFSAIVSSAYIFAFVVAMQKNFDLSIYLFLLIAYLLNIAFIIGYFFFDNWLSKIFFKK